MKTIVKNRLNKVWLLAIIFALAIVIAIIVFIVFKFNNDNTQNNIDDNNQDSTVIDDIKPDDQNDDNQDDKPIDVPACSGSVASANTFILDKSAKVYTTASDAKNRVNPALTYQPGEYYIFKCFDGMANISRVQDMPGGWINPESPYDESSVNEDINHIDPEIDIMGLDNTIVNWSHEYPTAFASEYNGFWNISPTKLYLTFDCGYDYNNLAANIMDTLKIKNIKAVFFVTGDFMEDRPDLVLRMINEGHFVGNHSLDHLNQPQNLNESIDIVLADIRAWEEKYKSITGSLPSTLYFRPPAGTISRRSLALMDQLGYKTLMWGAAYKDWDTSAQPTLEYAMQLLRQYTTPGDIVLLHGISQTSADILGQYIDEYRSKGFEFLLP